MTQKKKKKVLLEKNHVKQDPSNIKRADKTKGRKRHLEEPARLKTPKEGSIKGRNREREKRTLDP
jgi:hypothetical protein